MIEFSHVSVRYRGGRLPAVISVLLVIIPLVSKYEQPLPLPRSITDSVLHGEEQESAPAGSKPRKTTTVAG